MKTDMSTPDYVAEGKKHRLAEYKKLVARLAEENKTTPSVVVRLFTSNGWRELFEWKEGNEFLHEMAAEKDSL